jgi:hypothetical protein
VLKHFFGIKKVAY